MARDAWSLVEKLCVHAERVSAVVLAALWPGRSFEEVAGMLAEAPARAWRLYVFGTLGMLLALALISASFGVIGLAVYFGAVVLLVR